MTTKTIEQLAAEIGTTGNNVDVADLLHKLQVDKMLRAKIVKTLDK